MNETKTIRPSDISIGELQGYLLSAVAPRPICLASTVDKEGNVNLSPFSFFNVFSANPPIMIFSPARRIRDNTTKHSLENILEVKEVVINIANYAMVEQLSLSSSEYEKGVNEFVKSGLTSIESELIRPPRVAESPISFECEVDRVIPLGDEPGAGNLIISKVLLIHINKNYLDDNEKIEIAKLDLIARMGGNLYCRSIPTSLFEIPKPIAKKGVGVDKLPESIRESIVLTGNDLGRLGNIESLSTQKDVGDILKIEGVKRILGEKSKSLLVEKLHTLAQNILRENRVEDALSILVFCDQQIKSFK